MSYPKEEYSNKKERKSWFLPLYKCRRVLLVKERAICVR